jgi:putative membrane protein
VTDERFPRDIYDEGSDPNAQLSLANERTFLAWIRTALALLAGAVAVQVPAISLDEWVATGASLLLLLAAGVAVFESWRRWRATERAIRTGQPLPGFGGAAVLAILLALLIIGVAIGVVVVALR